MSLLPAGKLRADALQAFFDTHPLTDPRVVVGPRVGEDAAVLDMGDRYLVATSDPVTFAAEDIAWYAVQANANDVAVRGARPRWFLATVLLPEPAASDALAASLLSDLATACDALGVALIGGHTEVTSAVERVVVAGTMLGEVAKDALVTTGGARVGDTILLTKGIPLEGAALLARERGDELLAAGVPAAAIDRARRLLRVPGLSVVEDAAVACTAGRVHAMHDPTEGGLATALLELAGAADVGLVIERDRISLLPDGVRVCEALGLDPLGTIASGALLLTLAADDAGRVVPALRAAGIPCARIGEVVSRDQGITLIDGNRRVTMPVFSQDEVARVLG
jgi:hydrogenase maturation factor